MMIDEPQLRILIEAALKEDVGDGDHSSLSSIPPRAKGKAVLKIKQEGILAGMEVAEYIFQLRIRPLFLLLSKRMVKGYSRGRRRLR